MPIISKETWDKFTQEEKDKIRKKYQEVRIDKEIKTDFNKWMAGRADELEDLFGKENLQPQLTYEDVARELFLNKRIYFFAQDKGEEIDSALHCEAEDWYHYPLNCASQKQAEKLLAINLLLNVAAYLNKGWNPDWSDENNEFYSLGIDPDDDSVRIIEVNMQRVSTEIVYFRTEGLAQQAIQILGEDTVRLALDSDW